MREALPAHAKNSRTCRLRCTNVDLMSSQLRSLAWVLPLGLLAFAVVLVPVRMFEAEGVPRYRQLRAELEEVRIQNERLARNVDELTRAVNGLKSDPRAIERVARDELGMIRDDEVVFQF